MGRIGERQVGGRVELIDVLRGFALAGILYAHFIIWHTAGALPEFVYDRFADPVNLLSMAFFGTFVFGKFFSLFSFLFGYSYFLSSRKRADSESWFLRRLVVLGVFGFLHHLLWRGDILLIYSILGVVLLFAAKMSNHLLLFMSVLLILNLPLTLVELFERHNFSGAGLPMQDHADTYYRHLISGSFWDILNDNLNIIDSKFQYQITSGRMWITMGFFMLGLWWARTGILLRIDVSRTIFRSCIIILSVLLLTGFLLVFRGIVSLPDISFDASNKWFLQFLFNFFNATLTITYICGLVILFDSSGGREMLLPLVYPGRMPLTNYIFQTVLGLILFYPFTLGLFMKTSPAVNALLVIPVFYLQILLSRLWLSHFPQGPLEWTWAKMTQPGFIRNAVINLKRKSGSLGCDRVK